MPWLSPKISHHPPPALRRCRDLGSVPEADQATGAVSQTLLALHPWHQRENGDVLKRASLPSMESIWLQVQLRWAGHVKRMEDVRMPEAVFFSELQEGKRDRCGPRKHHKDRLKRQTAQAGVNQTSRWQGPQRETAGVHQ